MNSANSDIRVAAKQAGVKMWQIAEQYGLHEGNFSRKLRHELPQEEKERIFSIIKQMAIEIFPKEASVS